MSVLDHVVELQVVELVPVLLELLRELLSLLLGLLVLLLAAVGDQADHGQHDDDKADDPVEPADVVPARGTLARCSRTRGHDVTSGSPLFQLGFRARRNRYGGSRPMSPVPARISAM